MGQIKNKLILFLFFFLIIFFFTNDFGLIDIEKTAIITAISIDYEEDGEYGITAQLAVPEATDTNSEKSKAQISGKGKTVGAAIRSIADHTGWFPQLSFCNLIIISNNFESQNIITILDFFARTLRIQDSALIVMADGNAREILEITSPLDNISSFALQKVLLKKPGFKRDVANSDIKNFCSGYYGDSSSSFMPVVKLLDLVSSNESSSNSASSSSGKTMGMGSSSSSDSSKNEEKKMVFDAKTTALFYKGVKTGELNSDLTLIFNLLTYDYGDGSIELKDIKTGFSEPTNYLVHVEENSHKVSLNVTDNSLDVIIELKLYCKISDQNSTSTDITFSENIPLPPEVEKALKSKLEEEIYDLTQIIKTSKCDLLNIKEKLYRYHHSKYNSYKDNCIEIFKPVINLTVSGQK